MFDLFAQDNKLYVFHLYSYFPDYMQLGITVYKDEKIYYVGFLGAIYYSGTMGWEGRNFYIAPRTNLEAMANQSAHLNEYIDEIREGQYDLFVSQSEHDRVVVVARNCSIGEKDPLAR
jgi:hypothetical protein